MNQLWRVFGKSETPPELADIIATVRALVPDVHGEYEETERGWLHVAFQLPGLATPLTVEHFWRDEEGVRAELQTWAAWLETCTTSPHHQPLMEHMIATQQVFTLRGPFDEADDLGDEPRDGLGLLEIANTLCQRLARITDGVYQVDNQGFFAADGTLLLREAEEGR